MEIKDQTATQTPQSDPTSKLEQAIKVARECVDSLILPDNSIYVIDSIIMKRISETVLETDEEVIFIVRQSKMHDPILQDIILVTNRKIAIAEPSVWHLLKIKSMALKTSDLIQYTKINEISSDRGLHLYSIEIKIAGSEPTNIEGITREDSELLTKFVQRVVEYLEG